jgi:hypothetical protein
MKNTLLLVASFGLLVSQGFGYNVFTTNIATADGTAVPILDTTGTPIAVGAGYVAVGTFSAEPTGTTAVGDIRSTFTAFGAGATAFANGVGAGGFFNQRYGASIPQGNADAPVGEQAYVLIGDGATLAASLNFAILSTGGVFGTEDGAGNGELPPQIFNAGNIGSSLIYGSLLTNVDTGLGVIFQKAIKLGITDNVSYLTYTTTDGKVTITDCETNASGELVIPNTIGGNPVTSIGDYAFEDCISLTSITIPDRVTSIGVAAFYGCSRLTSITIPDGVTSLGLAAFEDCTGLKSITIGNGVKSIGDYAFFDCTSLTSITIPDSVTSIGDYAFLSCTNLTGITIGNSVTSIGQGAFSQCSSLTSITIPDSVTSIGQGAFRYCRNLASIRLESMAAPTIGPNAFGSISRAAVIQYPRGATGYAASYNGVPTEVAPAPAPPVLDLGDFYEPSAGVSVVVSAIPTDGYPTNYTYQWYFNNFTIPPNFGGTADSYAIDGISSNEGTWRVVVTNDAGSTEASFEYRVFSDADSDGLSDYRESNITNTNPSLADTDSDGLNDFVELNTTLTDPNDSDSDDDTLLDGAEVNTYGSDPNDTDSDDDSLLDAAEVNTYDTSPIDADSDNDTLADNHEILTYFTNPNLADSDSDGLSDAAELNTYFSLPNTSDTDGDGLNDGDEVNTHNSSPIDSDSDDDTILDGIEVRHAAFGFDPAVESSAVLTAFIAAYDQVVAERDNRATLEELQDARAGSVVVTPTQNGTVILRMMIEESADLTSWEQNGESVEVELPLTEGKKFLRFAMPSED